MKRLMFFLMFITTAVLATAQDDEYKMEIGAGVGLSGYLGDYNGSLTNDLQPMASVIVRRLFSPYMGVKANLSYGRLKGNSSDVKTYYPGEKVVFDNTIVDFGALYEYNFWPYGTGREYRGAKRLTPFITLGLGFTYADTKLGGVFDFNLPIGLGVKYKIASRVNLGLEWVMHFSKSDKLDNVIDPYLIKSTGLFKNADSYSALQFTITYSFMPKCRICNNDND